MIDRTETLQSMRANFVTRRENLKETLARVEKQIKFVDSLLLEDPEETKALREAIHILQAENDQLNAELRDANLS